jgi:hypothetical protein
MVLREYLRQQGMIMYKDGVGLPIAIGKASGVGLQELRT